MLKTILLRMKRPKIFLAVVSGVAMILVNLNIIDMSVMPKIEEMANIILSIGVAIGIFSSPEVDTSDTNN